MLDCGKYEHILDWTANGKVILVKDTEIFSNVVLPALFEKDAKFESFTRKMRRWGFSTKKGQMVPSSDSSKKPNKNRTKYLFQHNEFQRNQPELCANISCSNTSRAATLNFDQLSNRSNSFQQQNLQVGIVAPSNFAQLNNAASFAGNSSLAQQHLSTPSTSAFMMSFQQQGNITDILNSSQNASMFLSNTFPSIPQLQQLQTAALSGDRASLLLLQQQQQQNQHQTMTFQNIGISQQGTLDDYSRLLLSQPSQNLTTMTRANLNLLKDEGHPPLNSVQNNNMVAMNLLQSFPHVGVNNSTSADPHRTLPVNNSNPYANQEASNFLRTASGAPHGDNVFLSQSGSSTLSPFGAPNHHANVLDSRFSQIQTPMVGQSQFQQNHYFASRLPQQHHQQQLPDEASSRKRTRNEVVGVPVKEQKESNNKTRSRNKGESSASNTSSV